MGRVGSCRLWSGQKGWTLPAGPGISFPCAVDIFFPNNENGAGSPRAHSMSSSVAGTNLLPGDWGCSAHKPIAIIKYDSTTRKSYRNWGPQAGTGAPGRSPHCSQGAPGTPFFPCPSPSPNTCWHRHCTTWSRQERGHFLFLGRQLPLWKGAKCSPTARVPSLPSSGFGPMSGDAARPALGG